MHTHTLYVCLYTHAHIHTHDMFKIFFIFREGKGGRKRGRNVDWLPLACPS